MRSHDFELVRMQERYASLPCWASLLAGVTAGYCRFPSLVTASAVREGDCG